FLPPDAKIDHPVQPPFREEELTFMNEQPGIRKIVLNAVDDFVEGHDDCFKCRLEQFQREVSGSLEAGNRDAFARGVLGVQRVCRDDDGSVAFTKACTTIEQHVFVSERRICGKTDGGYVVGLGERCLVERLNIRKDVCVFVSWRRKLMSG